MKDWQDREIAIGNRLGCNTYWIKGRDGEEANTDNILYFPDHTISTVSDILELV